MSDYVNVRCVIKLHDHSEAFDKVWHVPCPAPCPPEPTLLYSQ